ncbi:MAG: acetyl-CoA carboxylase carboxyltransferase subunit alpha [Anaerovoracaceae bacterium]
MPQRTAYEKLSLVRRNDRPRTMDYIEQMFSDFVELKGDRRYRDDPAVVGGIALYRGIPVTVLGHRKGRNVDENIRFNFGMPNPEGYRKSQRLAKQAEKFGRPVICFIDTPGAYPGKGAEERGQGQAIADNIALFSNLRVPIVSIVIGEGGSGGALAFGLADSVLMLENAIYEILSPEGFASILWRDSSLAARACRLMKPTAQDLKGLGIIDEIVREPAGGAHTNPRAAVKNADRAIYKHLSYLMKEQPDTLVEKRFRKYRRMDGRR